MKKKFFCEEEFSENFSLKNFSIFVGKKLHLLKKELFQ